jgi:glycosyltransferase involved in cell wall biosynthesis
MPETLERSPIAQAPLSAILVAFNGGPELEEVIAAWDAYFISLTRPYEILLVNDASADDTECRAGKLAEVMPHLRVLSHEQHLGTGAALRTGLQSARYPLVLTVPCDKQYQPPDLYRVLEAIDQVDLVAGYRVGTLPVVPRIWDFCGRFLARVMLGASLERRGCWPGWIGWGRRWLARWLFGVRVQDPECPYRLYRREVLQRLSIQSNSSVAQIEILAKANHLECVMAEVPVSWVPPKNAILDSMDQKSSQELRRLFFAPDFGTECQLPSGDSAAILR